MRLADLPRGDNRAIINRLFNGDPPFDENTAEENNIQVNRNDLEGVNAMAQARRQWTSAFLRPGNLFSVHYDSGTPHKRRQWGHSVARNAARVLKSSRKYVEQTRGSGGNSMLHGIAPSIWKDRRSPIATLLPISSVMIPSETDIDFENLSYLAFFQEWTPAQLWSLTHGPKTDPGWNMPLVQAQWKYVHEQYQKQPNATAFQYMPERIEELIKQDMGFWGSDAVPTVDVWDFYFREKDDGDGWYRRVFLDWGVEVSGTKMPESRNRTDPANDKTGGFLYTSGKRKYADWLSEFFHCQFADCSAVFPQKYHSVRSLGWLLWGVCDLENRLHCKFTEALFEQLMWFFRVANNEQLTRLRRADFFHFGAIPNDVQWVKAEERYAPPVQLVEAGFQRFKGLIQQNSAAFTQDFSKGGAAGKEMTATETMALVNSVNALVSSTFNLAYVYEEFKDREDLRRLCIKNNPDARARKFRKLCIEDGVPEKMLDVDRMEVTRERAMGGGNKTLEMAMVQFLQGMRKNLGPQAQREVDHIAIESATDDARLADRLAPMEEAKPVSNSVHDAQLATDRLMRGLPFSDRPDMVYEDYVRTWLADLTLLIESAQNAGGMATAEEIVGFQNMAKHIGKFLEIMAQDDDEKPKIAEYQHNLNQLMDLVKGFQQRLIAQAKARAKLGGNGADPKDAAKAQAMVLQAQTKARLAEQSHAQKTAQRQVSFELKEQQQERQHNAEMRRIHNEHQYELLTGAARELAAAGRANEKGSEND